jgi:hypothetical protein
MVEPLSQREPDVLRLLGTDLSGPDIAGPPGELSRALLMGANPKKTHAVLHHLRDGR